MDNSSSSVLPAVTSVSACDHDVTESKTIGELSTKCAGCNYRKMWPWAKMAKCRHCKTLWHRQCAPSRTLPSAERTPPVVNTVTEAVRCPCVSTSTAADTETSAHRTPPVVKTTTDGYSDVGTWTAAETENKNRARRLRRRKKCKSQKTEDVLDADKNGRDTGNPSDITLRPSAENAGEPRNIRLTAVSKESKDADEVSELWGKVGRIQKQRPNRPDKTFCANEQRSVNQPDRSSSKGTKKSISLRSEGKPDCKKKQADALNKSCEDMVVTKSSRLLECSSSDNKNKAKRLRRHKNGESVTEKLQKNECILNTDERNRVTGDPSDTALNISSNNADFQCKIQEMVVSEQGEEAADVSELWRLVAKPRKQRIGRSDNVVTCAKDQIKSYHAEKSFSVRFERKPDYEKKPPNALKTRKNTPINTSSVMLENSSLRKLNNHVKVILNEMTPQNIVVLSKSFAALPIDTVERLKNIVDLVFEKAIQNPSFAQLCADLCSATQSVNVTGDRSTVTTSFQTHILRKCQKSFEADKAQRMDFVRKLAEIKSCKNFAKKKELQFNYDESEKRLRKRSLGNCRFIGELFKQRLLKTSTMEYCIASLVSQQSESSIECLCSLFRTIGKESEQCCNLNETLDTLNTLSCEISISSRIGLMIQEILDMRKNR